MLLSSSEGKIYLVGMAKEKEKQLQRGKGKVFLIFASRPRPSLHCGLCVALVRLGLSDCRCSSWSAPAALSARCGDARLPVS